VPNTHLGENMTALAIPGRVLQAPKGYVQPPLPTERVSVILNFGIIDILQEYNMSKQIEHSWKVRAHTAAWMRCVATRRVCVRARSRLLVRPCVPCCSRTVHHPAAAEHLVCGPHRLRGALQRLYERHLLMSAGHGGMRLFPFL
jgi:hypothetical protein